MERKDCMTQVYTNYWINRRNNVVKEHGSYASELDDEYFLFEELAEPYRDRLVEAMGDGRKVQDYIYDQHGRMISSLKK